MLRPIGQNIVVKRIDEAPQSESGILLARTKPKSTYIGEVVSVGSECKNLKAGDTIMYSKYAGCEVKIDGEALTIMVPHDVLGIVGVDE